MADGDDRRIPKASSLTLTAINSNFRQIAEMIYKLEGRKGPISLRDDVLIDGNLFVNGEIHDPLPYVILSATADQSFFTFPIPVSFDLEIFDTGNLHNTKNPTRITIPRSGVWQLGGNLRFVADTTGSYRSVSFLLNGVSTIGMQKVARLTSAVTQDVSISTTVRVVKGDYIELVADSNTINLSFSVLGSPTNVTTPIFSAIWLAF